MRKFEFFNTIDDERFLKIEPRTSQMGESCVRDERER